jgi:hypothetical protein
MALFEEVRNVSGVDRVVVVDGDRHEVKKDATLKVPAHVAGEAPRWRRVEVDAQGLPTDDLPAMHVRNRAGHLEVFDLGSGLLAQPDNWQTGKGEPADPTDAGGGQLLDLQAAGGQTLITALGDNEPNLITTPETSGAVVDTAPKENG